jgi:hypothetical protein
MVAVGLGVKSCTLTKRKHGQGRREAPVMRMLDNSRLCLALRIVFQHTFEDFDTLVGRTVVDKDDIKIVVRLLEDRAGAPLDIFLHAVYRHENADCVWAPSVIMILYRCF